MANFELPPFKPRLAQGIVVSGLALIAALTPAAADERTASQSAVLAAELKVGLAAAEARIEALKNELVTATNQIRELNAGLAASQNRIERLHDGMNEAWARILRLEAGNPAWLERVEAAERKHSREIQETLERLRNAPRGKTLNELFRVGERRRARPEVGYDEVPLPDIATGGP
ncbi:MAG: hypothetical protein OXH79_22320 [Boseongicola sp.]|nr:hypothetical protein [Boseongicola sp.]